MAASTAYGDKPRVPFEVIDLGRLGFEHDPSGRLPATGGNVPGSFDINSLEQIAFALEDSSAPGGPKIRPKFYSLRPDYGVTGNTVHDIFTVFGGPVGVDEGAAFDVNDAGVIVGQVGGTDFFEGQAYVWILDSSNPLLTTHVAIPFAPGTTWSRAVSVSEDAPWTVVVQTSTDELCSNGSGPIPHVRTYTVSVDATGVIGGPQFLADDGDAERSVVGWAANGDGGNFVGSDQNRVDGTCATGGFGCGDDQSALFWSGPSVVSGLPDFDSGSDSSPSEARDVARDGTAVGFGIDASTGSCAEAALIWDSAGSVGLTDLSLAPVASGDTAPPLDDRSVTWAEGLNERVGRTAVGWDSDEFRAAVWYEVGGTGSGWEVMFPGNGPSYTPHSIIAGSCIAAFSGADAVIPFLYDVNVRDAAIGRADVSGLAFQDTAEMHLVLLLPRWGVCLNGSSNVSADTDRDGDVDLDDLLAVLSAWGPCANCSWCPADVDGDRMIGFQDLIKVVGDFSTDCVTFDGPPQSVQDCLDRFGSDLAALEACISTLNQP